jgi:hypothetical protein
MSEEKAIGGIKSTNEFHPPKRERKKTDTTPVSKQEAELDLQQIGEETGHKPVTAPAPKPEKPMTLTLKGKDLYYGSREIWTKLFGQFNLTAGKLMVRFIEFEETNDPTIVTTKLVLAKAETSA